MGLGDDQGRIVGRYSHAIGEGYAVSHLSKRAIGGQHSNSRAAVDVDIVATVPDNFVPAHASMAVQLRVSRSWRDRPRLGGWASQVRAKCRIRKDLVLQRLQRLS